MPIALTVVVALLSGFGGSLLLHALTARERRLERLSDRRSTLCDRADQRLDQLEEHLWQLSHPTVGSADSEYERAVGIERVRTACRDVQRLSTEAQGLGMPDLERALVDVGNRVLNSIGRVPDNELHIELVLARQEIRSHRVAAQNPPGRFGGGT